MTQVKTKIIYCTVYKDLKKNRNFISGYTYSNTILAYSVYTHTYAKILFRVFSVYIQIFAI